jgi:hypothetical protein
MAMGHSLQRRFPTDAPQHPIYGTNRSGLPSTERTIHGTTTQLGHAHGLIDGR